ncbi:MAG: hypothetical protein JSW16_02440 [Dehalococcoidales bacterium]|nr:MAG: hypothetical protein JSW16_02440 [Dehalococcoidales bacterium]
MEQKAEMSVEQVVLLIFKAINLSLTEVEYKLVGIPRLDLMKRRRFDEVYKTLLLYLFRLSLEKSFPEHSVELLKTFDRYLQMSYENHPATREKVLARLSSFRELTKIEEEDPFQELAQHITGEFRRRGKSAYVTRLNKRIHDLYSTYLNLSNEIEVR